MINNNLPRWCLKITNSCLNLPDYPLKIPFPLTTEWFRLVPPHPRPLLVQATPNFLTTMGMATWGSWLRPPCLCNLHFLTTMAVFKLPNIFFSYFSPILISWPENYPKTTLKIYFQTKKKNWSKFFRLRVLDFDPSLLDFQKKRHTSLEIYVSHLKFEICDNLLLHSWYEKKFIKFPPTVLSLSNFNVSK